MSSNMVCFHHDAHGCLHNEYYSYTTTSFISHVVVSKSVETFARLLIIEDKIYIDISPYSRLLKHVSATFLTDR